MARDLPRPQLSKPIHNTGVYSFLKENHTSGSRPTRGSRQTNRSPT